MIKEVNKSFKYRIYPDDEQEKFFNQSIGNSRFVFNNIKNNYENLYEEYKNTKTKIHANRSLFNTMLNNLKAENEFLTYSASTSLQCAYEDLIQSFKNFIRKLKNGEIKIMQANF